MTELEKAARHWTECKEQATEREWSAYGDRRQEAFIAGALWMQKEIERLDKLAKILEEA